MSHTCTRNHGPANDADEQDFLSVPDNRERPVPLHPLCMKNKTVDSSYHSGQVDEAEKHDLRSASEVREGRAPSRADQQGTITHRKTHMRDEPYPSEPSGLPSSEGEDPPRPKS